MPHVAAQLVKAAYAVAFLLPTEQSPVNCKVETMPAGSEVGDARRRALIVLLAQVSGAGLVCLVCAAGSGTRAAFSALVGGGIGALTTLYMAFVMLRPRAEVDGSGAGRAYAARFVLGWAIKVFATIASLVIAFRSTQVAPLPLLSGYLATFPAYWFGAARFATRRRMP